jgi:hypothetical protein
MLSNEIIQIIASVVIAAIFSLAVYIVWQRKISKIGKIEGTVALSVIKLDPFQLNIIQSIILILGSVAIKWIIYSDESNVSVIPWIIFIVFMNSNITGYNKIWYSEKGFIGGGIIHPLYWENTTQIVWDKDIGQSLWGLYIHLKDNQKIRLYFQRNKVDMVKSGFEYYFENYKNKISKGK